MSELECHCGKDGHPLNSINCPLHSRAQIERILQVMEDFRDRRMVHMFKYPDSIVDESLLSEELSRDAEATAIRNVVLSISSAYRQEAR